MIKTKLISLILAGTVTGGGIIAGVVSQINSNTQKATTQITQSTSDLRLASGAMDTAQKTIVNQNDKISTISKQQQETSVNLSAVKKNVSTQQITIAKLEKELAAKNVNIVDLQKKLKFSEATTQVYIDEVAVVKHQLWVANTAVGQLQNDLMEAGNNTATLKKELAAEQAKVTDLQKKLKFSEATTQVYIDEVAVVKHQLWVANTSVGMLQNDLATANASLATANKKVATLEGQVTSLKAQLATEKTKNASQASDINKLKDAVNSQTKSIDSAAKTNNEAQAGFQKSLASFNTTVQK